LSALRQRLQTREPGKLLELFVAEIPNGPTLRFHNGTYPKTFQGEEYQPYPIKADGWEYTANGVLPRPHLTVTNIDGAVTALMRDYDDLIGTVVTRKRTLAEFLDDKPTADPTAEYPTDVYQVDSLIAELPETAEFEMLSPLDNENVTVPMGTIKAASCGWLFRGPDCGYDGPPKVDADGNLVGATVDRGAYDSGTAYAAGDAAYTLSGGVRVYWVSLVGANTQPLTDPAAWKLTLCPKRLIDCKLHFGADNPLSFEGFPGSAKLPRV
jgi:lambda family phage minor tail protein L